MNEPDKILPSPGLKERIKAIGSYSILLACIGIGMTIASVFWSSSNTSLQNDLRRSQEELGRVISELAQVKSEYDVYRHENPAQNHLSQKDDATSTSQKPPLVSEPDSLMVTVEVGKTAEIFGKELLISLIQTAYQGSPPRYQVIATIASPGYPELNVKSADIGFATAYSGKGNYQIRILKASTFSAQFQVMRVTS